jgi:N-methylhydantoinase A
MKRVGIDIGGTFTDIVVFDEETGDVTHSKTLSTPQSPEKGFVRAMELAHVSVDQLRALIHGTTLVTNLILERKGARIGLITTRGFRDVLEIMRASRPLPFDLGWRKPRPIVPRDLRVEVNERVNAEGEIVVPLDREEVAQVIDALLEQGVEGIAVCLLHSYVNDLHERAIREIIGAKAPNLPISISSRICREIREYERTNTTVVNSYAMPRVKKYVSALNKRFSSERLVNYLSSEGGLQSGAEISQRPISLCFSGPAGGVLGGSFIGQLLGRKHLITIDMGGTSLDVAVICDGRFAMKNSFEIEWGVPVKTATIDISTIGAGGGSIVWIDEGGALRVGPQSAGADPGPACYGRGGAECTVTDANLVLGLINPDGLLGGSLKLDREAAEKAVQRIAERFSVTTPVAAEGIYRVVNAAMAAAIRRMTIEKGIDPRDFALLPFGGAGGQHAVALAREVGISEIIVPNMPSVFSAFGMVSAPFKISRSLTVMRDLSQIEGRKLASWFAPLEAEIRDSIEASGFSSDYKLEHSIDLRYAKQAHEINIPISLDWETSRVAEAFEEAHRHAYGTRLGHDITAVTARLTAVSQLPALQPRHFEMDGALKPEVLRQAVIVGVEEKVSVFDRASLAVGSRLNGPALIEEADTSFYMPPKAALFVDRYKNLIIETGIVSEDRHGEA